MLETSKAFSSFSVNDMDQARKFYSGILGLQVNDTPMGVIEVRLGNGPTVMLYPKPDHAAATFTVLNFPVENIDDAVASLAAKGVRFEQYGPPIQTDEKGICRAPGGPRIAWFRDPAGNILSVLQK